MSKIAVVVGSLRKDSYNRRLAHAMVRLPAAQGHHFHFPEIGDLPLHNQDHEQDPPAPVTRFKGEIRAADGVMFVTPEYNRSIPGVLKNAIDTASRPFGDGVWGNKPAGVIGVAGGAIGTALAQQHLRNVLAYLDMPTLNQPEAFIRWTDELITSGGEIGEHSHKFLDGWMAAFLKLVEAHSG